MRMGIAAYSLGRYPEAANQLEKALTYNSKDAIAQLYLYDTYKLLGKNTKAYRLSKSFTKTLILGSNKKKKLLKLFMPEWLCVSDNNNLNDKYLLIKRMIPLRDTGF